LWRWMGRITRVGGALTGAGTGGSRSSGFVCCAWRLNRCLRTVQARCGVLSPRCSRERASPVPLRRGRVASINLIWFFAYLLSAHFVEPCPVPRPRLQDTSTAKRGKNRKLCTTVCTARLESNGSSEVSQSEATNHATPAPNHNASFLHLET